MRDGGNNVFREITKAVVQETRYRKSMLMLAFVSVLLFMIMLRFFAQLAIPADITAVLPKHRRVLYIHLYQQDVHLPLYEKVNMLIEEGKIRNAYLFGKIEDRDDILIKVPFEGEAAVSEEGFTFTIDEALVPVEYWFRLSEYTLQINGHTVKCAGLNRPTSDAPFPKALINLNEVRQNEIPVFSKEGVSVKMSDWEEMTSLYLCVPWNQYEALGLKTLYVELVYSDELQAEDVSAIESVLSEDKFEFLINSSDEYWSDVVEASHKSNYDMLPVAGVVFGILMLFQLIYLREWIEGYGAVMQRIRLLGCPKHVIYVILFCFTVCLFAVASAFSVGLFFPLKNWLISEGLLRSSPYQTTAAVLFSGAVVVLSYTLICIRKLLKGKAGKLL